AAHEARGASWHAGATARDTTSAMAGPRGRPAGPSRPGSPSLDAIAQAAATCPCGTDRVIVTASDAGTSGAPFSPASIRSTTWAGSDDRLATVSFLTLPPSR